MARSTGDTPGASGIPTEDREGPFVRLGEWVLVDGDRAYVAAGVAVGVFLLLLGLYRVGFVEFVNDDSVTRLAGGMIAGSLSLVTLVVSINQLILSREFQSAGEVREQVGGIMEFLEDVEDAGDIPATPAAPSRLFEVLVADISDHATALPDAVGEHPDAEFRELAGTYAHEVRDSMERLDGTLEGTEFGTVHAVSAAIRYDQSRHLYVARHLRNRYGEAMSEEARQEFDALIAALGRFNVAREHFKTTYLQRELTRFSQLTVAFGVPSVVAAVVLGLVYADFDGATLALAYVPYVSSALITVVMLPLALLAAYILRTATITRRTASVGPMAPKKDPEQGPFDVTPGDD